MMIVYFKGDVNMKELQKIYKDNIDNFKLYPEYKGMYIVENYIRYSRFSAVIDSNNPCDSFVNLDKIIVVFFHHSYSY